MEQVIRFERTKWISRIMAVIAVVCGLGDASYQFYHNVWPSFGVLCGKDVIFVIGVCFIWFGIYLWLAVLLWRHDESKCVNRWALLPSVVAWKVLARPYSLLIQGILVRYVSRMEAVKLSMFGTFFLTLLSCGIIYLIVKRIAYHWLNRKEQIEIKVFSRRRNLYFGFLSFTFWIMIIGTYWHFATLNAPDLKNIRWPLISVIGTIVPLVLAIVFFVICRRLFITKPLKALEQSPKDLNNGSPGCSAAEPGVKG